MLLPCSLSVRMGRIDGLVSCKSRRQVSKIASETDQRSFGTNARGTRRYSVLLLSVHNGRLEPSSLNIPERDSSISSSASFCVAIERSISCVVQRDTCKRQLKVISVH